MKEKRYKINSLIHKQFNPWFAANTYKNLALLISLISSGNLIELLHHETIHYP
ncbi:hypothetical protein [Winogradskyella bathintestinalis]|uniref:Uncharacterized protein n=1 Tax=Winogradskyella bathintestinalis TaxID=3035208 RepID=A0ABT7ZRT2_9FLAO|nr:hypothetical protein [Winogradskyella bathintestinalis]MDN3491727.1 hypothetical protein [Winogradskyella bathintestinalis]